MRQKLYIGCKIIKAEQMDECSFLAKFKNEDVANRETRSGYLVIYPSGYKSWSPSEVFETAYREVVRGEVELFREIDAKIGQPESEC